MDFRVATHIYTQPWLIESHSANKLIDLLQEIKEGRANYSKPELSAQVQLFATQANVVTAPTDRYAAKEFAGYEGNTIAIVPIIGPLMKGDYCGMYGTASLRNELARINATESIKTIVFVFSTPGGTVSGTESFAADIKNSPKETIGFIEDVCGSAGYWLASSCQKLYATSKTDIVGSIGTMFSIVDRSAYLAEQGIIERQYTADASKDKNLMIKEALQGRGKLLVEEWLNPLNDVFIANVKANRGAQLNEKETLTGKTFLADKALELGLIDGIKTLDKEIQNLLQKNQTSISMKISSTFKNIMAFVGLAASTNAEVELSQEQLAKIEAALPELESAKQKVTQLEAAAAADKTKIEGLEAKVTELTTAKTTLETKNTELKAEVEKLGNQDGGKMSSAKADSDPKKDSAGTDAMQMDFQKNLMNQL